MTHKPHRPNKYDTLFPYELRSFERFLVHLHPTKTEKMKQIKIFPKDWLLLHPYKQSTPVDSYYTSIANRIYGFMEQTELSNSFEGDETKQICIRLAAYFEDVISELGIWRTFINSFKEKYGSYLPFYTPDDHYYDDEVNLEDVRFLLWHYTQQFHGQRRGTFVSPDNQVNEKTAKMIYQLFCDEWTTAPENSRMKKLFSKETRYEDQDSYEPLLQWFYYNMYLFTDSNRELTEQSMTHWDEYRTQPEKLSNMLMNIHQRLIYVAQTELLGWTTPQWMAKIMPADHPDMPFMQEIAELSKMVTPEEVLQKNKADYEKFQQVAEGKLLLYFKSVEEVKNFITEKMEITLSEEFMKNHARAKQIALYATEKEGIAVIVNNLESIKDENNPFYDEAFAAAHAIVFFVVKHCSIDLIRQMEERGMLADAQAKSTLAPTRGKAIIHENWEFLCNYFFKE